MQRLKILGRTCCSLMLDRIFWRVIFLAAPDQTTMSKVINEHAKLSILPSVENSNLWCGELTNQLTSHSKQVRTFSTQFCSRTRRLFPSSRTKVCREWNSMQKTQTQERCDSDLKSERARFSKETNKHRAAHSWFLRWPPRKDRW
eukprot:Gregarina_sp_Poly_1__775@NODE_1185_length_4838_cov_96_099350_g815_i0_p4_GENE_NODE_1185_length_4838_cov_96_099350_g815_i0NODE_1185_length_4838_cov_96_099350_g815_i0_p4_ORF_typecomplete_len145_score0_45Band_3_cyto/PF07565_13/0_26Band_3_cyto/PF07565_13/3_9e02_NODE_1185_length_4838_cov_96_099350_g815_i0210644